MDLIILKIYKKYKTDVTNNKLSVYRNSIHMCFLNIFLLKLQQWVFLSITFLTFFEKYRFQKVENTEQWRITFNCNHIQHSYFWSEQKIEWRNLVTDER